VNRRPPQNPTEVLPALTEVAAARSTAAERCSACGAPRVPGDVFCEACGYDFVNGAPAGTRWEVVISADRERFELLAAAGLEFPDDFEPRTLELGGELRVGRGEPVDIADPAVSRAHLTLERRPDGSYALVDNGSTNGTWVNDAQEPIEPNVRIPLVDGDRIHVGAWTRLTLRRAG
jgi:hypothetical protein